MARMTDLQHVDNDEVIIELAFRFFYETVTSNRLKRR
jgi:hypothetical protein